MNKLALCDVFTFWNNRNFRGHLGLVLLLSTMYQIIGLKELSNYDFKRTLQSRSQAES